MSVLFNNFYPGMRVRICEGLHHVDDAIISDIMDGNNRAKKRVRIKSLNLMPDEESEMIFISEENLVSGWYLVFPGLFDEPCFNPKGPVYSICPI